MKNFEFEHDGAKYWYSRSVAVAAFVYGKDRDGDTCILAIKRGKGAETCKGMWAVPSGYLDFNETTKKACQRELWEETGLTIGTADIEFVNLVDNPSGKKQNIVLNFTSWLPDRVESYSFSTANMEPDEIAEIKWVKLKDLSDYKLAYDGNYFIKSIAKQHTWFKRFIKSVFGLNDDRIINYQIRWHKLF